MEEGSDDYLLFLGVAVVDTFNGALYIKMVLIGILQIFKFFREPFHVIVCKQIANTWALLKNCLRMSNLPVYYFFYMYLAISQEMNL